MLSADLHVKLWVEHEGQMLLGQGPAELLSRIETMGSLKKAAESLNMSYRAAWGRLKRTEDALGCPLVLASVNRREGYQLTAEGKEAVDAYRLWLDKVRAYALREAPALSFLQVRAKADNAEKTPQEDMELTPAKK